MSVKSDCVFSVSGGLVYEFEKSAVVRLDRPRHVLSTLLPAGSGGRKASVHWSAPLKMHNAVHSSAWCRSLSSVSHPADDFRRTACTSLLRYVVERAGGQVEDDRTGEIYHVKQPQGKTRANKTADMNRAWWNCNIIQFNFLVLLTRHIVTKKLYRTPDVG